MWLINTQSLRLEAVGDPNEHAYAILSHTWEDGEVTFQEIADLQKSRTKPGFAKIEWICQLAHSRCIKYAWVDTCCIDKSSSAELTEAINSMFRWYKNSAVCFVFLSDLPSPTKEDARDEHFPKCRWFTRGWTLQELIAPTNIELFDQDFKFRGTKLSLQPYLSEITGIPGNVLGDSGLMSTVCVARRMSWASKRHTSRTEDLAYCLFGIFGVNLPLIYGEGEKAFIRLQEAIVADTSDLSLFAWTSEQDDQVFRGIFARSPSEFLKCGNVHRDTDPTLQIPEFRLTNKGFHIATSLIKSVVDYQLNLQCLDMEKRKPQKLNRTIGIHLLRTAHGYVRHRASQLATITYYANRLTDETPIYISKALSRPESQILEATFNHEFTYEFVNTTDYLCYAKKHPAHLWDSLTNSFKTEGHEKFTAILNIELKAFKKERSDLVYYPLERDYSRHYQHKSNFVVIFGLARNDTKDSTVSRKLLKPWASIYWQNGLNNVTWGLIEEGKDISSDVLRHVGEVQRSRISNGEILPITLGFNPLFQQLADGAETGRFYYKTLQLSLSTTVQEENGLSLYRLFVKIEKDASDEKVLDE